MAAQILQCAYEEPLLGFLQSWATFSESDGRWHVNDRVLASALLAPAFGSPLLVQDAGEWTHLTLPVHGATLFGYPVLGLEHYVGNENGVNVLAITLQGSTAEVQADLGPRIVRSARWDAVLKIEESQTRTGGVELMCDWSM